MAEVKYNLGTLAVVPSGSVIPFAGSTAPQGYLLCDGREVSRTDYPYLFDVIGTTYGEGDGSTTFNLPDLRESTLVGVGENTTKSIAEHDVYELGQFKDDQSQGHRHYFANSTGNVTINFHDPGRTAGGNTTLPDKALNVSPPVDNGNGTPRTGKTTHGKQTGVNYIIKY